ncbi:MAG: hypothetical protein K2W95_11470 [Candidatus Obscuribacterales bacterium]|nr:hypothetical protein [Candidatus Obscuribacterales bacterium]
MNETSIQHTSSDPHLLLITCDQSDSRCNFVIAPEVDCSVDESPVADAIQDQVDTIQDIPLADLYKEIERRAQEIKSAEADKVVEISSSTRWREHFSHKEFKRQHKVVFHGDEYAVLKVRLKSVIAQRERMCAARAERKSSLNMSEVDAYSTARYRRNMTRATQRESTKAMVHWFGSVSHYKMVESHLNRDADEATTVENKVVYTSNWSRNFHGLQEAHGY